jgi:hypothetical protein
MRVAHGKSQQNAVSALWNRYVHDVDVMVRMLEASAVDDR